MRGYRRYDSRLRKARGLRVMPPSLSYSENIGFNILGKEVELLHPPAAHTRGDTMVYLPKERVLFTGDVVWESFHPNLEDADVEGWIRALASIRKMKLRSLIPGHGGVTDRRAAGILANYISSFHGKMIELARRGSSAEDAAKELEPSGTAKWRLNMIIKRNAEILLPRYRRRYRERTN